MHKNACGAILADRPDRGHLVDPLTAAEIEALGADNEGKDAEIESLKRANAHPLHPAATASTRLLNLPGRPSAALQALRAGARPVSAHGTSGRPPRQDPASRRACRPETTPVTPLQPASGAVDLITCEPPETSPKR